MALRPLPRSQGCCLSVDERERILDHRHHAEAEQIDFHDPHVGAVVLVPLHDDAAGHARVFERHARVELPLADHHAAGVLPEMPRQILHLAPQPREQADARRVLIEADRRHLPRQRVARIDELEVVHHLREPVDLRRIEAERLPHLARRAAPAVRDHVGRHRRAEAPVFFVDVLDDLLAPVAARQIEIDVGPLAALLRQKPLEQQIHADRIDRRDPEAVADGAVGRRSAALHEDVVLPAEIHDVPDDEEVAGELELLDEIQLARDLRAGLVVVRPVALARADVGDAPQERRLRSPCGTG